MILTALIYMSSCNINKDEITTENNSEHIEYGHLPQRAGDRPATTPNIPHAQLDLDLVSDVHEEMVRRIYAVPGIKDKPSAIMSWRALWLDSTIEVANTQAFISGREFGHIHDDGSLHIFLEPSRAKEAIETGWAVAHPFNVQGRNGWEGFVMLYTPQSMKQLNIVFQLIVDSFNYVTGQQLNAEEFYG